MLLTRSRLCPVPKSGSSLHLHVLGTPPAFVLSQDQTLREELHKELSGIQIAVIDGGTMPAAGGDPSRVRPWWDADPCAHCIDVSEYTGGGVERKTGQSWHRRLAWSLRTRRFDGVEPGHTISIDDSIDECACC